MFNDFLIGHDILLLSYVLWPRAAIVKLRKN